MSKNTEAIFILLFSIFIFTANGQVVKFIKNPLTAKYRVFITRKPAEATLLYTKPKNTRKALVLVYGIL